MAKPRCTTLIGIVAACTGCEPAAIRAAAKVCGIAIAGNMLRRHPDELPSAFFEEAHGIQEMLEAQRRRHENLSR